MLHLKMFKTMRDILILILMLGTPIVVAASTSDDNDALEGASVHEVCDVSKLDPLEPFNRKVFAFNQALDKVALKPVATFYNKAVPSFFRGMLHNFLHNLTEPVNFLNGLLQLNPKIATRALSRFVTNSFLGLGGLHDVAGEMGVVYKKSTFGQTMKAYGIHTGPYLVLPVVGSSSFRDALGLGADVVADPFNHIGRSRWRYTRLGFTILDTRASVLSITDYIERTSLDQYSTYRSLYFQQNMSEK